MVTAITSVFVGDCHSVDVNRQSHVMELGEFIRYKRKSHGLSQRELASQAGVGLRFIYDLEQGKETVQLNKVNSVLKQFGYQVGPMKPRGTS